MSVYCTSTAFGVSLCMRPHYKPHKADLVLLYKGNVKYPSFLMNPLQEERLCRDEWTRGPFIFLPYSLYTTGTSTFMDVAQFLPMYICLNEWVSRPQCVCSPSQRSSVPTTERGPYTRTVLVSAQRACGTRSVPLIVISIICTNTNCVNTREHGSP